MVLMDAGARAAWEAGIDGGEEDLKMVLQG